MRVPKYLRDERTGQPALPPRARKILTYPSCRATLMRTSREYLACAQLGHGRLHHAGELAGRPGRCRSRSGVERVRELLTLLEE